MKIIITSTPVPGHLNPLLSIGKLLVDEGHEVLGLNSSVYRNDFERIGAEFRPFPHGADMDLRDAGSIFPELKVIPPGPQFRRFVQEHVFIDPIPAQYAGLQETLRTFPADVVIADHIFLGTLPFLLSRRAPRPAIIHCGISVLMSHRDDVAPYGPGFPPTQNKAKIAQYKELALADEEVVGAPSLRALERRLNALDISVPSLSYFDIPVFLPDAHLQFTVPGFEYPRRDMPAHVHFVGALPLPPSDMTEPHWAHELDGTRKIVLVTQGTIHNQDLGELIAPTLKALAKESDMLVVVTTGGRPADNIPAGIPKNARVAQFLPYNWLFPKVHMVVTNGGFGTVNQALRHGIPLVTAGVAADKAEIGARVAWSGAGINLATNNPTITSLGEAVRALLNERSYRDRALSLAQEFSKLDTESEIFRIIFEVTEGRSREARSRIGD